jgi:hypothetical protein
MNSEVANSLCIAQQTPVLPGEIENPFQQDTLPRSPHFHKRLADTFLKPEERLMLAILEDAIRCFQTHHSAQCGNSKRLFEEVRRWIFHTGDDCVFGFENICSVLGLNPGYIRRGLVQWREKEYQTSIMPPWGKTQPLSVRVAANRKSG